MSRFTQAHIHSASVRAEMKALQVGERRLPFGTMLISVVALASTASVISMLVSL